MDLQELTANHGATALTLSVLNRLMQATAAYQGQHSDDVLRLLQGMQADVTLLEAVTARLQSDTQNASDNAQRLTNRLLILIGNIRTSQANLRTLLDNVRTQISMNQAQVTEDDKQLQQTRDQLNQLRAQVTEIRSRYEEAAEWAWVPGYGQYLAGRALADTIDGKLSQITSDAADMQTLYKQGISKQNDIAKARGILSGLDTQVNNLTANSQALETQKSILEQQNKVYARRIAFALNMNFYYKQLNESLDGIATNLDHVMHIARRLSDQVTRYDLSGAAQQISLHDALLQLATDVDTYRPANGADVHHVDSGFNGKQLSWFIQIGQTEWAERSDEYGKFNFKFTETLRDDWSVYLRDPSRQVSLQLDLWKNTIYYTDPHTPRREQYQILGASNRVTGWVAVAVEIQSSNSASGYYVQVEQNEWSEIWGNQVLFNFQETKRDDWTIYLYDSSRGVSLELDLWRNKVYYAPPGTGYSELYDIVAAS